MHSAPNHPLVATSIIRGVRRTKITNGMDDVVVFSGTSQHTKGHLKTLC